MTQGVVKAECQLYIAGCPGISCGPQLRRPGRRTPLSASFLGQATSRSKGAILPILLLVH